MKSKTVRISLAGLGAAALTVSSVLMGGLAASAADEQLGPEDIIPFEVPQEDSPDYNYFEWHIGSTEDPEADLADSLEFGDCSVTIFDKGEKTTQVMKGYPIDARPSTIDQIREVMLSTSIDVQEGTTTLQFPFFYYVENEDGEVEEVWDGTWRTSSFGPGDQITEDTVMTSSIQAHANWTPTLGELLEDWADVIENGEIENFALLGVGFTGSDGTVVESFSFGGDDFYFGTGDCLPAVDEVEEEPAGQGGPEDTAPTKPQRVETAAL